MTASAPATRQTLFKANLPRWGVVVLAFLLGALALMIVTSPRHFRYDEVYHLRATRLIGRLGWKEGLNSPQNTSSAGPMYSAIHLLASPLTHLRPPAVRYINWFFLVVVVAVTAAQLRRCKAASPLFAAGLLLAVPFLWPSAGLALTELPALAAFALFLLLFQQGLDMPETSLRYHLVLGAAAGAALGIAVLGRQTYLVVVPCLALLGLLHRRRWILILTCIVACLLACGWLFWIWRGLIPPAPMQAYVNQGICWEHALMGAAYMGTAALFVAPRFLRSASRVEVILGLGIVCLWAVFLSAETEPPARTLLLRVFGEPRFRLAGLVIHAVMIWAGTQWLIAMVKTGWASKASPWPLFLVVLLLALAFAPVKITCLFSSRYVVTGLGALCLLSARREQPNAFSIARLLLGALIGAAVLETYYR